MRTGMTHLQRLGIVAGPHGPGWLVLRRARGMPPVRVDCRGWADSERVRDGASSVAIRNSAARVDFVREPCLALANRCYFPAERGDGRSLAICSPGVLSALR